MASLWSTFIFLLGFYWPFLLAALLIGLITGWLSLSRPAGDEAGK